MFGGWIFAGFNRASCSYQAGFKVIACIFAPTLLGWVKPCKVRRLLKRCFLTFGDLVAGEKGAACKVGFSCRERRHEPDESIIADVLSPPAKPAFAVARDAGAGLSIGGKVPIRAVAVPAWCMGMFGKQCVS